MINIILCGGAGTRLWPLSRTHYPKQFYPLLEGQSLFQKTILRNLHFAQEFVIVVHQDQLFLAQEQVTELNLSQNFTYIIEPLSKNTAPAIAVALAWMSLHKKSDTVIVTPSDHLINDVQTYQENVRLSLQLSQNDIVLLGITPHSPETGYGYIQHTQETVTAFKEKPDFDTAQIYLNSGNYLWNSGMFIFTPAIFYRELEKTNPHLFDHLKKISFPLNQSLNAIPIDFFSKMPSISIDYALIEKTTSLKVYKTSFDWSDVGSFDSLYQLLPKNSQENTVSPNLVQVQSSGNLVISSVRTVALSHINNLMIIDTPDAILITPRGRGQDVKELTQALQKTLPQLTHDHLTVHRPWGHYTILQELPEYKVKKLFIKPGHRISLQTHQHRNEHWIVVKGKATVTIGDETRILNANESTYIPAKQKHRLANQEIEELVIIEAQIGNYLGEDDIQRFDDDYKR